jgi:DNA-binding NarL/FixJ family response regulator
MKKIRILLANSRPRIMREVIRQLIKRQPDMEIVGEVLDLSAVVRTAQETRADVIIVALEDFMAWAGQSATRRMSQCYHLRWHRKVMLPSLSKYASGRLLSCQANILSAFAMRSGPIGITTQEHSC